MLQAERHAAIGNGAGIRSENAGLAATEDTLDDAGVDFVKVESECTLSLSSCICFHLWLRCAWQGQQLMPCPPSTPGRERSVLQVYEEGKSTLEDQ